MVLELQVARDAVQVPESITCSGREGSAISQLLPFLLVKNTCSFILFNILKWTTLSVVKLWTKGVNESRGNY